MKIRSEIAAVASAFALLGVSCTSIRKADNSRQEASIKGKYAVVVTENSEKVQGTCKFIRNIEPQWDPVQIPAPSQLSDYYKTEAVLLGADTVLVRGDGRLGEAYICGPGPLNPDGTRREGPLPPSSAPTAPPQ